MKYFYTNAPLSASLDLSIEEDYEKNGLNKRDIILAMAAGFQQMDGDKVVTLLPISDEAMFMEAVKDSLGNDGKYGYIFQVVEEAQAISIRDKLIEANKQTSLVESPKTPTDEDLYRASVLKLLTEIKVVQQGGENNV